MKRFVLLFCIIICPLLGMENYTISPSYFFGQSTIEQSATFSTKALSTGISLPTTFNTLKNYSKSMPISTITGYAPSWAVAAATAITLVKNTTAVIQSAPYNIATGAAYSAAYAGASHLQTYFQNSSENKPCIDPKLQKILQDTELNGYNLILKPYLTAGTIICGGSALLSGAITPAVIAEAAKKVYNCLDAHQNPVLANTLVTESAYRLTSQAIQAIKNTQKSAQDENIVVETNNLNEKDQIARKQILDEVLNCALKELQIIIPSRVDYRVACKQINDIVEPLLIEAQNVFNIYVSSAELKELFTAICAKDHYVRLAFDSMRTQIEQSFAHVTTETYEQHIESIIKAIPSSIRSYIIGRIAQSCNTMEIDDLRHHLWLWLYQCTKKTNNHDLQLAIENHSYFTDSDLF